MKNDSFLSFLKILKALFQYFSKKQVHFLILQGRKNIFWLQTPIFYYLSQECKDFHIFS